MYRIFFEEIDWVRFRKFAERRKKLERHFNKLRYYEISNVVGRMWDVEKKNLETSFMSQDQFEKRWLEIEKRFKSDGLE